MCLSARSERSRSEPSPETRWRAFGALLAAFFVLCSTPGVYASSSCPEEQLTPQLPVDLRLCEELEPIIRRPRGLPLNEYQAKLGTYLQNFCHRDLSKGWKVDKRVRDTGPYVAAYLRGSWSANYYGTHAPVLVWYSPDMFAWLKANRNEASATAEPAPLPDGAMIIKEMYTPPAAACGNIPWDRLRPTTQGAAIMIRDSQASQDGWFWGWVGWTDWQPDWPNRAATNAYPFSGFGQYCTNCHSSAANNQTFSTLKNIAGEPGDPLVYLTQRFFLDSSWQGQHSRIAQSAMDSTPFRDGKVQRRLCPHLFEQTRTAQPALDRAHALRDLRQCLGEGRPPHRRQSIPDLGPVPRLPQRRRHRSAVRHDRAGTGRQARQQLALRHLEGLADGPRRPRPVLFRPARERDRNLPSNGVGANRGHLLRLPRHSGPAPSRHRSPASPLAAAARSRAPRSMPPPIRRTIRSAGWRTTERSRATACHAPHATAWCSDRTLSPSMVRSRRMPACSSDRRRSIPA